MFTHFLKFIAFIFFFLRIFFYLFSPLNPLLCIVQVCNAYTELNDPIVQRERFAEQLKVLYMFSRAIQSVLNVLFVICSSLMLVWISGSRVRRRWSNGFGWDILYGSWVWVASDCWLGSRHRSAGYVAYWLTKYQGMWILSLSLCIHACETFIISTHHLLYVFGGQEVLLFPAMKPQDEPAAAKGNKPLLSFFRCTVLETFFQFLIIMALGSCCIHHRFCTLILFACNCSSNSVSLNCWIRESLICFLYALSAFQEEVLPVNFLLLILLRLVIV